MERLMTPLSVGILLVVTGGSVAWFHLGKLISDKSKTPLWYYVPMTLLGGLAISVGANLIATGIHDRLQS
tara:strand:+ start:434 stop:643 length:210 start_codon:yes stop_codon:yes gene_type:complete